MNVRPTSHGIDAAFIVRKRLVIFDFDGTLADSINWFGGVVNELARRYDFKETTPEQRDEVEWHADRGREFQLGRKCKIGARAPCVADRPLRNGIVAPGKIGEIQAGAQAARHSSWRGRIGRRRGQGHRCGRRRRYRQHRGRMGRVSFRCPGRGQSGHRGDNIRRSENVVVASVAGRWTKNSHRARITDELLSNDEENKRHTYNDHYCGANPAIHQGTDQEFVDQQDPPKGVVHENLRVTQTSADDMI